MRVFICYGGRCGRIIGLSLRAYLSANRCQPFLAGRGSPDVPAGEDFQVIIDKNLRETHVMITICDLNVMRSKYARAEIRLAEEEGILNIPFLENTKKLPTQLARFWAPVRFDPANAAASFPELLAEIHRSVIFRTENFFVSLGNNPNSGLPITVLRQTRR